MRALLCALVVVGCTRAPKQEPVASQQPPTTKPAVANVDPSIATLKQHLANALAESEEYLSGKALPSGEAIRALVDTQQRDWWTMLTPVENFLLFEISPAVAARAPADVRAAAFCAGVRNVFAEWWSVPGGSRSETTQHVVTSDAPAATCLVELFDDARPLRYLHGETDLEAEHFKWTRGDLAAGIVALVLREQYNRRDPPDVRAARRAELRSKVR